MFLVNTKKLNAKYLQLHNAFPLDTMPFLKLLVLV